MMNKKIIMIFLCFMLITTLTPIKADQQNSYLNNPPIADAGGPYNGIEGDSMIFDASASFDPDGDDLMYRWDFDGDEIWDTDWSDDPLTDYAYCDDYDFKAFVEVSDGTDSTYANSLCVVENAPPEVFLSTPEPSYEGEDISFYGTVSDPGWCDDYYYVVACTAKPCPDDAPPKPHIYSVVFNELFDEWWWDIAIGYYNVFYNDLEFQIMNYPWEGDKGFNGIVFPVGDNNPDVTYHANTPTHIKVNFSYMPPNPYRFTLMTNVKDPQIKWWCTYNGEVVTTGEMGAPSDDDFKISLDSLPFNFTLLDDCSYTYELRALDDDGAAASYTVESTVENIAPAITPFGPFSGEPGETIEMSATVEDPGTDDITLLWEFGDGDTLTNIFYNLNEEPDNPDFPFMGTAPFIVTDDIQHIYENKGKYTVTLTATDDEGGQTKYTTSASTPKIKTHKTLITQGLFARFPVIYSIFKQIIYRFYAKIYTNIC